MGERSVSDNDPTTQRWVEQYGYTATRIGINQVQTARLQGFYQDYLSDEAEPIYVGNDEYTQRRIGLVTLSGVMIHARLHRQPQKVCKERQHVLVVDSFASTDPVEFWRASSSETNLYEHRRAVITATELMQTKPAVRSLETDDASENTTSREATLNRLLTYTALPQMVWGSESQWQVRVAAEGYDMGHDIRNVVRAVTMLRDEQAILNQARDFSTQLAPTGSDT